MASTPSSPSSTAAPQQRQRLRGLLPSLSSLLPSPRRRTRPLKFQCELRVLSLRDYPQSGVLFVKWKDGQGNEGVTPTRAVDTNDYSVIWDAPFSFPEAFRVDEATNLPLPQTLHFSVRQVNRRTGAVKRVGVLDLNLSELLSAGSTTRAFLLQESRYNAALSLSLNFKQLIGDALYRCPLAAREADEFPSPEEASSLRPRSLERERQRRASSSASSGSSGGGSLYSSSGGSGYYNSSSRRASASASASSVGGDSLYGSSSSVGGSQEEKEGTEGRPRPVSLPHTAAPAAARHRHGHSNTWSTPLDESLRRLSVSSRGGVGVQQPEQKQQQPPIVGEEEEEGRV